MKIVEKDLLICSRFTPIRVDFIGELQTKKLEKDWLR
jgi:hypothetical protein